MDNIEIQVLQRILTEGSIKRAISLGLRDWHFTDPVCQDAWTQIVRHSKRKATLGQTPSFAYLSKLCPDYPINSRCPEERLGELIGDLLGDALKRELHECLADVTTLVDNFKQPMVALEYLVKKTREMAQESSVPSHVMMDLPVGLQGAFNSYQENKTGKGMKGIPWPWEPLNLVTQGQCDGALNIFYAPSKHGKTWICLYAMMWAFLHANARILIVTTEMPCDEIWERCACLLAKLSYRRFTRGEFFPDEEKKLQDTINFLIANDFNSLQEGNADLSQSNHRSIRVIKGLGGGAGFLRDQIDEYEPDLLFVDGIYNLAEGDQNHNLVKKVLYEVKHVAMEHNLPITATAQSNRSGWVKLEDIDVDSYSDIGMSAGLILYADTVIRIHRFSAGENDQGTMQYKQYITVPAGRKDFTEPFIVDMDCGVSHDLYAVGVPPAEAAAWADKSSTQPTDGPNFQGGGDSFL